MAENVCVDIYVHLCTYVYMSMYKYIEVLRSLHSIFILSVKTSFVFVYLSWVSKFMNPRHSQKYLEHMNLSQVLRETCMAFAHPVDI